MVVITVDNFCRLCLKESFTLSDIYSYQSSSGDSVYKILNFIYDLEIRQGDGLSSKICSPCSWRMIEFQACKKNVHHAKAEMLKLIGSLLNDSDKVSFDETNDGMGSEAEIISQNEADKLPEEVNAIYSDIAMNSVKDEIEIEEWTIPDELLMRPELTEGHISESGVIILQNAMNFCNEELKISQEDLEGPEDDNASPDILSIQCAYEEVSIKDCCAGELSESATKGKSIQNEELDNSKSMKIPKRGSRKGFVCDICRKSFAGRRDIRDHVRVHYDDRPFVCEHCGKGFKQSFTRRIHELKHLKQEKLTKSNRKENLTKKCFTCETCGNQYANHHALYQHSIKHTSKYSCHLCEKSFSNKANLKNHIRVHSTERPFVCKVCQKSFNRKSNMLRHIARHTEVKVFNCSKCDKKFKTKHDLDRHELFHL